MSTPHPGDPLSETQLTELAAALVDEIEAGIPSPFSRDAVRAAAQQADRLIRESVFVPVLSAAGTCPLRDLDASGLAPQDVSLVIPPPGRNRESSRTVPGQLRRVVVSTAADMDQTPELRIPESFALGACAATDDDDEGETWGDERSDADFPEIEEVQYELRFQDGDVPFDVIHAEAARLVSHSLPPAERTFVWSELLRRERLIRRASEPEESGSSSVRVPLTSPTLSAKSSDTPVITASSGDGTPAGLSWSLETGTLNVTARWPGELKTIVVVADLTFETPSGTRSLPHAVTLTRRSDGELRGTLDLWVPSAVVRPDVTLTVREPVARDLAFMSLDERHDALEEKPSSVLVCRTLDSGVELTADLTELDEVLKHPRAVLGLRVSREGVRSHV